MSVRKILIWLGIFIALLPYLGFPSWFDAMLNTFAGLAIVFFLLMGKSMKPTSSTAATATPASPERPNETKELRVKRSVGKNAAPMRVEKPETFGGETDRTALVQNGTTERDAGVQVSNARMTISGATVSETRGRGTRPPRLNKS